MNEMLVIADFNEEFDTEAIVRDFASRGRCREPGGRTENVELGTMRLVFRAGGGPAQNLSSRNGLWLCALGTVFSNRVYRDLADIIPKVLKADEVLGLYEKFGKEFIKYIKGSFVIVLHKERERELTVVTSRLCTMPLFYYNDGSVFVLSSSLGAIVKSPGVNAPVNEKAAVERLLFHHCLGEGTLFRAIYQVPPGSILTLRGRSIELERYWTASSLFGQHVLPEEEGFGRLLDIMKENVRLYTSDAKTFLLSLTGGFDGRTNLALTERAPEGFLCYSYGRPGSPQIEIPLAIAKRLGLRYMPIYLDEAFEARYEECALKALEYSDGAAPILRANFPYAFEKLRAFSTVNVSGLFGSELIKPFYRANEQVTREAAEMLTGDDFDTAFRKAMARINTIGYIQPRVVAQYADAIRDDVRRLYFKRLGPFGRLARLYVYLLEEAIRKYFMQEISIEAPYVDTRTPYLDEDFVTLLFATPYAGIRKGAGKKSVLSRRKSHLLYARLIQSTKPALGGIVTDRGYAPKDLLAPAALMPFVIGLPYARERLRRCMRGDDTFRSPRWSKRVIEKYIHAIGGADDIFTGKLIDDFEHNAHLRDDFRFFSVFSLRLWFYLNR